MPFNKFRRILQNKRGDEDLDPIPSSIPLLGLIWGLYVVGCIAHAINQQRTIYRETTHTTAYTHGVTINEIWTGIFTPQMLLIVGHYILTIFVFVRIWAWDRKAMVYFALLLSLAALAIEIWALALIGFDIEECNNEENNRCNDPNWCCVPANAYASSYGTCWDTKIIDVTASSPTTNNYTYVDCSEPLTEADLKWSERFLWDLVLAAINSGLTLLIVILGYWSRDGLSSSDDKGYVVSGKNTIGARSSDYPVNTGKPWRGAGSMSDAYDNI